MNNRADPSGSVFYGSCGGGRLVRVYTVLGEFAVMTGAGVTGALGVVVECVASYEDGVFFR